MNDLAKLTETVTIEVTQEYDGQEVAQWTADEWLAELRFLQEKDTPRSRHYTWHDLGKLGFKRVSRTQTRPVVPITSISSFFSLESRAKRYGETLYHFEFQGKPCKMIITDRRQYTLQIVQEIEMQRGPDSWERKYLLCSTNVDHLIKLGEAFKATTPEARHALHLALSPPPNTSNILEWDDARNWPVVVSSFFQWGASVTK